MNAPCFRPPPPLRLVDRGRRPPSRAACRRRASSSSSPRSKIASAGGDCASRSNARVGRRWRERGCERVASAFWTCRGGGSSLALAAAGRSHGQPTATTSTRLDAPSLDGCDRDVHSPPPRPVDRATRRQHAMSSSAACRRPSRAYARMLQVDRSDGGDPKKSACANARRRVSMQQQPNFSRWVRAEI